MPSFTYQKSKNSTLMEDQQGIEPKNAETKLTKQQLKNKKKREASKKKKLLQKDERCKVITVLVILLKLVTLMFNMKNNLSVRTKFI